MKEASYYEKMPQGLVCRLCPKGCMIGEGQTGFCRVRRNTGGKLYAENYGRCAASGIDPIEKKPLYHFYPGSTIFSLGTWGCNFSCQFCQNWQIAQGAPQTKALSSLQAVELAAGAGSSCIGIAYTYSEPSVWFEFVLDTAKMAHLRGLKNVLVTNGFINPKPLEELLPYIDAFNIDVKAFTEGFYHKVCQGQLEAVKQTVVRAAAAAHVEITCLVIPSCNDSLEELTLLAQWLSDIHPDIPLHFSRYFPNYKMDLPPTPLATMEMAYRSARRYLNYVYLGNLGASDKVNTKCPACDQLVLDRQCQCSYLADDKKCPRCGSRIYLTGEVLY